jgi:Na+/phosphate symporter
MMNAKTFLLVSGTIAALFSVPFIFYPGAFIQNYSATGDTINSLGEIIARAFGAMLLGLGVGQILARNATESYGRKGLLAAATIGNLISAAVYIHAGMGDLLNGLNWSSVVLTLVIGLWGLMLFLKEKPGE